MRALMRDLVGGLSLALAIAAIVASLAVASAAALSVDGGTLQTFTIAGGPDVGGPDAPAECSDLTFVQKIVMCERTITAGPIGSGTGSPNPGGDPPEGSPLDPPAQPPADRASLLEPCPDHADCVIYVIRAGDNLVSIVRFFGVAMHDTVALNPWLERTPHLPVGVDLRLPWPDWLPDRPGDIPSDPTPGQPSADPTPSPPSPDPEPTPSPQPTTEPTPTPEATPTASPPPTASPEPTAEPTTAPSASAETPPD